MVNRVILVDELHVLRFGELEPFIKIRRRRNAIPPPVLCHGRGESLRLLLSNLGIFVVGFTYQLEDWMRIRSRWRQRLRRV